MNCCRCSSLAARVMGVLLALAMLGAPSLAQVDTAERCRTGCESAAADANSRCCGNGQAASHDGAEHGEPQTPAGQTQSCPEYCAGCAARPLAMDAPRLSLALDLAPMLVPDSGTMTSASINEPFAIFHPPRA